MTEWRPIPGHPGYFANAEGQILSRIKKDPRILRPAGKRYLHVYLQGGVYKDVHRLVAAAFYGDFPGLEVNHKDLDTKNNRVENLEWATPKENIAHAISHGRHNQGERHGLSKLTDEKVRWIRTQTAHRRFKDIAAELNVSTGLISQVHRRIVWDHVD